MTTPTKAPAQPAPTESPGTATSPARRKFTVDEYYRMAEVGILHPDERVELIDGEIVLMAPMGNSHATGVRRLERVWHDASGNAVTVSGQCPIRLSEYADPEPDVAILSYRIDDYSGKTPGAEDVLLIIEVSDTTLAYDRGTKLNLYAEASIPETWIMNLVEDCIESFTQPSPDGYAQHAIYRRGDTISPSTLPDVRFAVDDLLPPLVEEPQSEEPQSDSAQTEEAQSEGEPQA